MNEEERVYQELKKVLLDNAPNLIANANRQMKETKQTDDETTYHVALHSIFF